MNNREPNLTPQADLRCGVGRNYDQPGRNRDALDARIVCVYN